MEYPAGVSRRSNLRPYLVDGISLLVTLGLLAAIIASDRFVFPEPVRSPLYQSTLQKAYSRFGESNMVIEAGRTRSPHAAGVVDAANAGFSSRNPDADIAIHERPEFKKAEADAKAGDSKKALRGFKALLEEQHDGGREANVLRHRVADLLVIEETYEEAIDLYRQILQKDNDQVCCFRHLGDVYRKLGRASMAERMFGSFVAGHRRLMATPGQRSDHLRHNLVSFYLDEKRELTEALRLMQIDIGVELSAPDRFLLARCLEANEHYDEARDTLASIQSDDDRLMKNVASFESELNALRARKQ
ncbi:MAG: hypothetical protein H6832_16620 [Planctomycetes bacterium]|nr:hypothetical protein [Planctomycetota bacterium]MCB9920028.1 hypothetical protein [Planctomycetota bacterium]